MGKVKIDLIAEIFRNHAHRDINGIDVCATAMRSASACDKSTDVMSLFGASRLLLGPWCEKNTRLHWRLGNSCRAGY
jgi:hypothetical protein